ncbi:site-specific integrase [Parashewanella spongiae]|uniref:Site-specific integrase n=1 Tax=Parashewanella spongiae TaxID=342950 RepID=A0A3A6TZW7_9GAMM|nr:site-specific integrase [Parashewanella spongiae]MCL1077271.1 site-specific integrase [Parashewanella spongiae]RJY18548.1 site-specific integrase [Parashewanella spongiae]
MSPQLINSQHETNATLTLEQIEFIDKIKLQDTVKQQTSSKFDNAEAFTSDEKWNFNIGGRSETLTFPKIKNIILRKLAKYYCVSMINSGKVIRNTQFALIVFAFTLEEFSSEWFLKELETPYLLDESPERYFAVKSVFRFLCQLDCPRFPASALDKIPHIPTPNSSNNFHKYQDIENAFPSALKGQITRALMVASKKRKNIESNTLTNLTIIGLFYYVGLRPIQYAGITVNNFKLDTSDNETGLYRYSLDLPYAKQSKITTQTVKIALPAELGLLIKEYITRNQLKLDDRFWLKSADITNYINSRLQHALLSIQPQDVQKNVKYGEFTLPRLTSSCFRHNVGHSLALGGASAEEIAQQLGHTSLIAASYYISATPDLALLKSRALGENPVWENMVNLMLTGYIVESSEWNGRTVTGAIGDQLHIKVGGCQRPDKQCLLAKVRSCYGCFHFRPFNILDKHKSVLASVNKELIETLVVSESCGNSKNPALSVLTDLKAEVKMVINRLSIGTL